MEDDRPPVAYCDRCSAQAHVRVRRAAQELDLCSHHYARHELTLVAAGWQITHDTRNTLTRPGASA
jgi:hypothetical protein